MTLSRQNDRDPKLPGSLPGWAWHGFGWTIYIMYEVGTIYLYSERMGSAVVYALFYVLNISLFYLNALVVLPMAFRRRHPRWQAAWLVTAQITAYLAVKCGIDLLTDRYTGLPHEEFLHARRYFSANLWRGMYFCGLSTVYWSVRRVIAARIETTELHNAFLQQQLRPHLLFNMLSLVYESFRPLSESAAACVASLTDVMRYSYEPGDVLGLAPLADEVLQLCNLVELNRLRYDFYLHLDVEITGRLEGHTILRFGLVALTENVFQHGDLTLEDHPARVTITVSEAGELTYESANRKKKWPHLQHREPDGLRNLATRLGYVYPGRYRLDITEDEFYFGLKLSIRL